MKKYSKSESRFIPLFVEVNYKAFSTDTFVAPWANFAGGALGVSHRIIPLGFDHIQLSILPLVNSISFLCFKQLFFFSPVLVLVAGWALTLLQTC